MILRNAFAISALLLAAASCVFHQADQPEIVISNEIIVPENPLFEKNDPFSFVWKQEPIYEDEKEEERLLNESLNLADHEQKDEVQKWIHFYSKTHKKSFELLLKEGVYYKTMIKSVLKQQNIPTYFYYLPVIESGFRSHAKSHAKAVGLWQFVAPTARRHGLRVDSFVDERLDPIRSTFAAGEYLKALHNVFHSWPLAIAAYNAGEMRIVQSIMSQKSRDFWELARKRKLPKETCHFFPKFMAAALIGNHPEKYGITPPKELSMTPVRAVSFTAPAALKRIGEVIEVDPLLLKEFNPHLMGNETPRGEKTYALWVPQQKTITTEMVSLIEPLSYKERKLKDPIVTHHTETKDKTNNYKVQKGDTLAKISRKFGVKIKDLRRWNGIAGSALKIGQKLQIQG